MSLRRALAFSYLEKYGSYGIGLVSTAILSRLLGPEDIGVFAVGMSVIGIVAVVRELGVSTYIVQETELNSDRIRAAFTLMTGMGLLLAALVLLLSWPMGAFYGDDRVRVILMVLALGFALTPLGSVSQALMARDLHFGALTWIRLLFAVVTAVVSIVMAWMGFGPLSLACGSVAAIAVNSIVSMALRPHPWRPVFSRMALGRVFAVGAPATVIAMLESFEASLPELLLGRLQGLSAAGLFSRGKGLSQMAHQMIARAAGPVFLAAFAALQREGRAPNALYERATACVTALGWTALAALAVLADPIVAVLFGPNWMTVVPLLRWLTAAAAVALLTSGANHLLLASGGARDAMWARLWGMPIFAGSLALGAWLGAEPMAASTVFSTALASGLLGVAVKRRLRIGWRAQLSAVRASMPMAVAGGIGASTGLLVGAGGMSGAMLAIVVGGTGAIVLAGLVLIAGSHPLKTELQNAYRGFLARRAASK